MASSPRRSQSRPEPRGGLVTVAAPRRIYPDQSRDRDGDRNDQDRFRERRLLRDAAEYDWRGHIAEQMDRKNRAGHRGGTRHSWDLAHQRRIDWPRGDEQ